MEKAVPLWQEMASLEILSSDVLFSLRELAMFFEHKEKDYIEAQKMAEEGFVLSRGFSVYYENDFVRRRERLKQKMKKQASRPDQEK